MNLALPLSFLLHAALLGWALISFEATPPLKIPEVQPVEVAIISPDDLVRLRQGDRSSKKLETRKAKTPEKTKPTKKKARKPPRRAVAPPQASEPPPATAEPAKVEPAKPQQDKIAEKLAALQPLPKPAPTPEELKKKAEAERKAKEDKRKAEEKKKAEAKQKAEAKKKAEAKRKAEAKKRAERRRKKKLAEKRRRERERRKKQFDPDKLTALLNKIPDKSPPSGAQDSRPDRKLPRGPRAGAPEGRDNRLTASQISLLGTMVKNRVRDCWRVQTGISGADQLIVDVEVKMDPSGQLRGEPRVVNRSSSPIFRDAAINAVRAIKQCAPYDLPKNLYKGGWDHMVVTFDPQRMFQ